MLRYIYSTSLWGVKIYNYLYKEFNIYSFVEANANKKEHELKCVISFLIKRESNDNGEPQHEINLPALLDFIFKKYLIFIIP